MPPYRFAHTRPFPLGKHLSARPYLGPLRRRAAQLPDLLDSAAATHGDALFLDYRDARITFTQFRTQVEDLAAGLLRLGLLPGDKIALYLPNTPYHPFAFFAALKAGFTVVHLSPLDAERELIHKLHDSGATTLITTNLPPMFPLAQKLLGARPHHPPHRRRRCRLRPSLGPEPIPEDRPGLINLADLLTAPTPQILAAIEPGRTRRPAIYRRHHRPAESRDPHPRQSARRGRHLPPVLHHAERPPERARSASSPSCPSSTFTASSSCCSGSCNAAPPCSCTCVSMPQAVLHDIEVKRATYFPGVPTMWIALDALPDIADHGISPRCARSPLAARRCRRSRRSAFKAMTGLRIGGGWGMTETAAAGASHLMQGRFDRNSVGVPLPGVQIHIVALDDPDQTPRPQRDRRNRHNRPQIFSKATGKTPRKRNAPSPHPASS